MVNPIRGLSEVIKVDSARGWNPNLLVWKYPEEDFNTTSQLIVDETHEALLVVNGNAADLFGPGRRTLSLANLPLAREIIEIPTDGTSPFPCKVFFVNKVHQMDMLWGTFGAITLEDPLYDVFLHVMANGSMSVTVENTRKFMLKLVGFRDVFDPDTLVQKFRGIISSHVKDCISKIMINGALSYFMINANIFELSGVIKERLDSILEEYGVVIHYFNIETIEVPREDYDAVTKSKERRTGRLIEGYSWQEERQMMIAEKFASNEGTMGNIGGAMGGFMMGSALGGSITDIAKGALDPSRIPTGAPPKDASGSPSPMSSGKANDPFNIEDFFEIKKDDDNKGDHRVKGSGNADGTKCSSCDARMPENAKFCLECGEKVQVQKGIPCPSCNGITPIGKFCLHCGNPMVRTCGRCNTEVPANGKFCLECGEKI